MIAGNIILETTTITFNVDYKNNMVTYTVMDDFEGERIEETFTVPQYDFLAALSIAIHNDGEPNMEKDYPIAEKLMGKIRWIP